MFISRISVNSITGPRIVAGHGFNQGAKILLGRLQVVSLTIIRGRNTDNTQKAYEGSLNWIGDTVREDYLSHLHLIYPTSEQRKCYGHGFLFSAITVQECGVNKAWSDFQRGPFTPSILRTQLEGTNKDGNGESGWVEGVDYLKRISGSPFNWVERDFDHA